MSHSSDLGPPLSCPTCSSSEINTQATRFPFIFAGHCYRCNNNCTSTGIITFYQCVCCPPDATTAATVGYTSRFPCKHKDSRIHQDYVKVNTPSHEPSSLPMHVSEDFDELSLDLSTVSTNSNDHMEIKSVINSGVGTQVLFPLTFGSKDELDSFLRLKIPPSSTTDIISTYDKRFQDYYEAAIDGKGANYIVNYILTKEANSYSSRSDSDTLFLLLYSKLTSTLSQKASAVFISLIDHILYDKNVYIPHTTADLRGKLLDGRHSLQNRLPHPRATELTMGYSVLSLENHI